jgi:hypothetical protein
MRKEYRAWCLAWAGCLALVGCAGAEPGGLVPAALPTVVPGPTEAAPPVPVTVPDVVQLGAERAAIEAALGEPAQVTEDAENVETVHVLGLPEPAPPGSPQADLARRAVSTVGGLLGPVGAIGGGLAGQALGGAVPDEAAERDLDRAVMVTIAYRDGKATRISRRKLGIMALAHPPAS